VLETYRQFKEKGKKGQVALACAGIPEEKGNRRFPGIPARPHSIEIREGTRAPTVRCAGGGKKKERAIVGHESPSMWDVPPPFAQTLRRKKKGGGWSGAVLLLGKVFLRTHEKRGAAQVSGSRGEGRDVVSSADICRKDLLVKESGTKLDRRHALSITGENGDGLGVIAILGIWLRGGDKRGRKKGRVSGPAPAPMVVRKISFSVWSFFLHYRREKERGGEKTRDNSD